MLWKGIIMLLHIDTAVLRSAVSVAEQTNSSISDAASLLNQITVHEDWICKERDQIIRALTFLAAISNS